MLNFSPPSRGMSNASGCLPILINIIKINHEERCGKIKHENYLGFW
jgi:hypothetical protein